MAPQLRGLVERSMKRDILQAVAFAFSVGFAYKYFVAWPRKEKYQEYYRNLDPDKEARQIEFDMKAFEEERQWCDSTIYKVNLSTIYNVKSFRPIVT